VANVRVVIVGWGVRLGVSVGPGVSITRVELATVTTVSLGSGVISVEGAQPARGDRISTRKNFIAEWIKPFVFRLVAFCENRRGKVIVSSRHVNDHLGVPEPPFAN
jgi:hypothetical protein